MVCMSETNDVAMTMNHMPSVHMMVQFYLVFSQVCLQLEYIYFLGYELFKLD